MLQVRKRRKKPQPRGVRPATTFGKFLGWCVHGYTALGLVAAGLIAAGTMYFLLFQRRRTGILAEHAAEQLVEPESILDDNSALSTRWIGQLAPGE